MSVPGNPGESYHRLSSRRDKFFASYDWLIAILGLIVLLVFQYYAYAARLDLSLGPRVILQPWLMQKGFILYKQIIDIHTPLMPVILAWLGKLFQHEDRLSQHVLLGLLTLTTLFTFLAGKRHISWLGGLTAAAIFVIWSPVYGWSKLWHESFLALIYVFFLWNYDPSGKYRSPWLILLLGCAAGLALLTKQHAALVGLVFLVWICYTSHYQGMKFPQIVRQAAWFICGAFITLVAGLAYLLSTGTSLQDFLYWTATFNVVNAYSSLAKLAPTPAQLWTLAGSLLLLPPALAAMLHARRHKGKVWMVIACGFLLIFTASMTIWPRFNPFHLQAVLPILAVLSVIALAYPWIVVGEGRFFVIGVGAAVAIAWLLVSLESYKPIFQAENGRRILEYSDLKTLAKTVQRDFEDDDGLYIFPTDESNANLYYLLRKTPPPFWVFHYPWYMIDTVQQRVLDSLEESKPDWIVYFPQRWDVQQTSPRILAYFDKHYTLSKTLDFGGEKVVLLRRKPVPPS